MYVDDKQMSSFYHAYLKKFAKFSSFSIVNIYIFLYLLCRSYTISQQNTMRMMLYGQISFNLSLKLFVPKSLI